VEAGLRINLGDVEYGTWHRSTLSSTLHDTRLGLTPSLSALAIPSACVSQRDHGLHERYLPRPKEHPSHLLPLSVMRTLHNTHPTTITQVIIANREVCTLLGMLRVIRLVWLRYRLAYNRHPPAMDTSHANVSPEIVDVLLEHPDPHVCAPSNSIRSRRLVLSPLSFHPRYLPFLRRQSTGRKNALPVRLESGLGAVEMRTEKQRIDRCVLGRAGPSRRVRGREIRVEFAEGFRNFDFKACSPGSGVEGRRRRGSSTRARSIAFRFHTIRALRRRAGRTIVLAHWP